MENKSRFFTIFSLIALVIGLGGCSFDVSISPIDSNLPDFDPVALVRTEPDFTTSEKVTVASPSGPVEITGSFGDITTEVNLPNGIVIEGAFYQ